MKLEIYLKIFFLMVLSLGCSESERETISENNPFWNNGDEFFDLQDVSPPSLRASKILVALDGTVLSFFGSQVRRSTDGGKTWGDLIEIGEWVRSEVVDETSGDIIVFGRDGHDWFGNIYRSIDDGRSWEQDGKVEEIENRLQTLEIEGKPVFNEWPVDLELYLRNFGGGSGNGITLHYGENKGRLVVPVRVQYRLKRGEENYESMSGKLDLNVVIYSDDGGKTWKQSDPVLPFGNDEAAVAELSDGTLYHNSRNNIHHGNRHISLSYDGGVTWKDHYIDEILPDGPRSGPSVFKGHYGLKAGLVRLPIDDHNILIFSNVDSEEGRKRITVWGSFDGGETWPVKRLVDEGPGGYSSLAAGRKGTETEGLIYLMYGYSGEYSRDNPPRIARFNLAWLTNGVNWKEYIN